MIELSELGNGAMALSYGGDTLNTLVYVSRLGISADYVTALGQDYYSDWMPEASVGVGTVLTTDQMKQAKEVGAAFAVSPGFDPTLVACAVDLDLFYMPGVATASEVMQAYAMELRCLKFFPAETMGGTATLSNFISPFGGIEFCPTGGIHESNLVKYLSLPNVFCVGGTWVATKEDMNARNWQAITARAKSAKSTAQTIYEGHRR